MLKVSLVSNVDKLELCNEKFVGCRILTAQSIQSFKGTWKAVTRSAAGTSTIAEPEKEGALLLTDLMLTTDRVAASSVTIRFTDDTNTINIITANVNDAPVNLPMPFNGRWQGWKDARIEIVTVGNVTATAACGYMKIPEDFALSYDEWNAER